MDEIAPEYDIVVLGTGKIPRMEGQPVPNISAGLTECVLSGYAESKYWRAWEGLIRFLES